MSAARIDRIIGLDLSLTSTGRAIIPADPDGHVVAAGTVTSTGHTADTVLDRARRLADLTERITSLGGDPHTLAVVEGPAFAKTAGSNTDRMGLWWMVVQRLLHQECHVAVAPPTVVKKWATGSGAADKAAVSAAVARLCPDITIASSDIADACALALIGAHHLGWRDSLGTAAHRRDALGKVAWPEGIDQ